METLMTIGEVAQITQLRVATLRKYVLRKRIPFVKLGPLVRFRPSDIEGWIAGRTHEVADNAGEPDGGTKGPELFGEMK
jgi:excisionase family DNA binding protein